MNENLIHFNKRKKICFNKKRQKNIEIYLMYKLYKAKVVYIYLQQQTKIQNAAIKINIINIIKKFFEFENEISDEKKIYDKNILMKI